MGISSVVKEIKEKPIEIKVTEEEFEEIKKDFRKTALSNEAFTLLLDNGVNTNLKKTIKIVKKLREEHPELPVVDAFEFLFELLMQEIKIEEKEKSKS